MSDPTLQIIIPVNAAVAKLAATVASLAAQTDKRFSVLLGEGLPPERSALLNEAERKLAGAGIVVQRLKAPPGLTMVELWNWSHHAAKSDWMKPLAPGETLKPGYVAELRNRIAMKPDARFIRCDAEIRTEWGGEILRAPFSNDRIEAAGIVNWFPRRIDWLSRTVSVAYDRTAWLALGGFSPQFPAFAAMNLNAILALHHGVENIAETLVTAEYTDAFRLNAAGCGRVNLSLELWLLLRQIRNYCLAAKIAWPGRCLIAQSLAALRGRV